ncbi:MAG TPA: choice-of-anchor tandem repeat GloVer-containing protein [Candidatus Saccharimonadales bacterium]|nr:choice-of-anchor tandem repeat GloVer-containing protein [Candidatus Saccharimonadales bacterium]
MKRKLLAWKSAAAILLPTLTASAQQYELVYKFTDGLDGASPTSLMQASDGNFYGSTEGGGVDHVGTIFRLTPQGQLTVVALVEPLLGDDITGPLVKGDDGAFYGTTTYGESGYGSIFRVSFDGGGATNIFSFNFTNGSEPLPLVKGEHGAFYGVTTSGGPYTNGVYYSYGTIFKFTEQGEFTTLLTLSNFQSPSGIIVGSGDIIYGTTEHGGAFGSGVLFRLRQPENFTVLSDFDPTNIGYAPMICMQAADGSLYGVTQTGGEFGYGTVFKASTNGTVASLVPLTVDDGWARVTAQTADGNIFGITSGNSYYDHTFGGVFRLPGLHSILNFSYATGSSPSVISGSDGNLYGYIIMGGTNEYGAIYRLRMPTPQLEFNVQGNQLVLSWPTNFPGYRLQSTSGLNSPGGWIDCASSSIIADDRYAATQTVSVTSKFYRLIH